MNIIKKLTIVLMLSCVAQFAAAADSVLKTMYIDGVQVAQAMVDGNGLTWPSDYITIGAEGNRGYMYNEYLGKIDDFAIYSGVLSETRVAAHYSARTNYTTYSSAVTADGAKLWLKFDDSSKANNATAVNSGTVTSKNGTYIVTGDGTLATTAGFVAGSNAVEFVGPVSPDGPGSCIDVFDDAGDFGSLLEGDVSVELWVNYTSSADYPRFFQHNGNWEALGGYGVSVNDSNQLIMLGGGVTNYASFPADINNGSWHHVVVTYDSTYEEVIIETGAYAEEIILDNPAYWLRFESETPIDSAVNGANHWVGYGSAASIVSKVGGVGNSVLLNGTNGAGVYGVALAKGPNAPPLVNGSYAVYGDQYALVPGDITIEMWYKTLPVGQPQPSDYGLFFQQHGSYTHEPCAPAVSNATGQIRVFGGSGAGYTGVNPRFDRQWHHLVVTYDANYLGDPDAMFVKVYMDGEWKDDTNFTAARSILGPELSHMLIGAQNDMGNTYNLIPAYYDEIAIYDGLLSADRIAAHYAAWQPQTCEDLVERGYASPMDFNEDCKVNFADFAEFAVNWMKCNDPELSCPPNW
ncbi:MAG: LamG-like jellyroll fold domain-containing protein [Phycisphaerae bacterium]|jgi:hypothetical protein